MNIRILSDLHFEYHADSGKEFVRGLNPRGVDVLILAGDITRMDVGFANTLSLFRKQFPGVPIVWTHGNHEYHGSDRASVVRATRDALSKIQGVHWLDCDMVEIGGQRILGHTLWYGRKPCPPWNLVSDLEWARGITRVRDPISGGNIVDQYTDFEAINGLEDWVYDENGRAIKWFVENIREGDIVVTHILPSIRSSPERFQSSKFYTNAFFVTEMGGFIEKSKAALWVHGHTHDSCDYKLGDTRVVCNPFGYQSKGELNVNFNEDFTVEV